MHDLKRILLRLCFVAKNYFSRPIWEQGSFERKVYIVATTLMGLAVAVFVDIKFVAGSPPCYGPPITWEQRAELAATPLLIVFLGYLGSRYKSFTRIHALFFVWVIVHTMTANEPNADCHHTRLLYSNTVFLAHWLTLPLSIFGAYIWAANLHYPRPTRFRIFKFLLGVLFFPVWLLFFVGFGL
jgi:hypothetical protein